MAGRYLSDNQSGDPARERKTIDLKLKIKVVKNFENGQTSTLLFFRI
jgi:hypothetical protein